MGSESKRPRGDVRAVHVHAVETVGEGDPPREHRAPVELGHAQFDPDTTSTSHESTHHGHGHGHDYAPRPTANAHAHAHDPDHDGRNEPGSGGFAHERLDAYRVALQMVAVAKRVADQIPRGHRNTADHLLRAASNCVLLLAEGANRRGSAEKRQRFVESRAEAAEVAAAADLCIVLDLSVGEDAEELKDLAGRVAAMLTGLIARHT